MNKLIASDEINASFLSSTQPFRWESPATRCSRSQSGDAGVLFVYNDQQSIVIKRQSSQSASIQEFVNQRLAWALGFRTPKISLVTDPSLTSTILHHLFPHAQKIDHLIESEKKHMLIDICKQNNLDHYALFIKTNFQFIVSKFEEYKGQIFDEEWEILATHSLPEHDNTNNESVIHNILRAIVSQQDDWDSELFSKEPFLQQQGFIMLEENIMGLSQIRQHSADQLKTSILCPDFLIQLGKLMAFDVFIGNEDRFLYPKDHPRFSGSSKCIYPNLGNLCISKRPSLLDSSDILFDLTIIDSSTDNALTPYAPQIQDIFSKETIRDFIYANRFILETNDSIITLSEEQLEIVETGFYGCLESIWTLDSKWMSRLCSDREIQDYVNLIINRQQQLGDYIAVTQKRTIDETIEDTSDSEPDTQFDYDDFLDHFPSVNADSKAQLCSIIESLIATPPPESIIQLIDILHNSVTTPPTPDMKSALLTQIQSLVSSPLIHHECLLKLCKHALQLHFSDLVDSLDDWSVQDLMKVLSQSHLTKSYQ